MIENIQRLVALGMPEGWEWIVILVVALLIFGRRLPDVARGLGKSLSQFKKGLREVEDAKDEVVDEVNRVEDDIAKQTHDAKEPDDSPKSD
jgi:sec-independent protein translocase protein TatA